MRSTASLFALSVVLILCLPASAAAATTIGSNLAHAPNLLNCGGNSPSVNSCSYAIASLTPETASPGGAVAPIDGVIVRWRLRAGPSLTSTLLMANLHVLSGNTSRASSANFAVPLADTASTREVRIPVTAGERIGVTISGIAMNGFVIGLIQYSAASPSPGVTDRFPNPLVEGAAQIPTAIAGTETLLNADIEPDVDRDGYGDETQDQCPGSALTQALCSPATIAAPRFKRGEGFSLSLSEAASLNVLIERILPGRVTKSGSCSARARRGKKCTIVKRVKTIVNLAAGSGPAVIPFAPKKLAAANYRATFTATTQFGQASTSTLNFKVKARRLAKKS